jgi:hypothetical protein
VPGGPARWGRSRHHLRSDRWQAPELRALFAAAAALIVLALASSCGGGGSRAGEGRAAALVAQTFAAHTPATSGQVALGLSLAAAGGSEAFALRASGPFLLGAAGRPPRFALDVTLRWRGPSEPEQVMPLRLVAGSRGLRLSIRGHRVRTAPGELQALQAGYAEALAARPGSPTTEVFAPLALDPAAWVVRPRIEGPAGGADGDTAHLGAGLAVRPFLEQLIHIAGLATSLAQLTGGGSAAGARAAALTAPALRGGGGGRVELYTGVHGHQLRSLSASASVTAPATAGEPARRLNVAFALAFTALDQPPRIPGA